MHRYGRRLFTASAVACAFLAFGAASVHAQQPTQPQPAPALPMQAAPDSQQPAMSPALRDSLQAMLMEAQQIQRRLADLQQQA
ncbi:MAG TPA: hypothetical protein VJ957_08930, partial [Longimicrobiales bacterium]|nr:hypothetical protein [Longimicrobiales bacterium]